MKKSNYLYFSGKTVLLFGLWKGNPEEKCCLSTQPYRDLHQHVEIRTQLFAMHKHCLSLSRLLWQSNIDWGLVHNRKFISQSCGGWKAKIKAPANPQSHKGLFPLHRWPSFDCVLTGQKKVKELPGTIFVRALIPVLWAPITSQTPCLLMPSPGALGCPYMNWWRHKPLVYGKCPVVLCCVSTPMPISHHHLYMSPYVWRAFPEPIPVFRVHEPSLPLRASFAFLVHKIRKLEPREASGAHGHTLGSWRPTPESAHSSHFAPSPAWERHRQRWSELRLWSLELGGNNDLTSLSPPQVVTTAKSWKRLVLLEKVTNVCWHHPVKLWGWWFYTSSHK